MRTVKQKHIYHSLLKAKELEQQSKSANASDLFPLSETAETIAGECVRVL